MKKPVVFIVRAAVIAAVYAALTVALAPIGFGALQFRVSEALTLLPVLFPEAIPGLFIGCLAANIISPYGIWDMVFGSLATLAAAFGTYYLRKRPLLAALPPILVNAVVIGLVVALGAGLPPLLTMLQIGAEEAVVVLALGIPLLLLIKKALKIDG